MRYQAATLHSGCKINLFLELGEKRSDGYHEISTLMYPLAEPHDILRITPRLEKKSGAENMLSCAPNNNGGIRLSCGNAKLDAEIGGNSNTIVKAYRAFSDATGCNPALDVHLEKNVPYGAGLGGGSADAATLLRYLNDNAEENALSPEALNDIAAKIGADVPFFLNNVPALATGIGEKLQPVSVDFSSWTLLLVCPNTAISTAWAYSAWDTRKNLQKNAKNTVSELTRNAQQASNFNSRRWCAVNSFEEVIYPAFPKLSQCKEILLANGAELALLSGSGASIFGLFRNHTNSLCAHEAVLQHLPNAQVFSNSL